MFVGTEEPDAPVAPPDDFAAGCLGGTGKGTRTAGGAVVLPRDKAVVGVLPTREFFAAVCGTRKIE